MARYVRKRKKANGKITKREIDFAPEQLPGEVRQIELGRIAPNGWNPQEMTKAELAELCDSMRDGMIAPIQVVPVAEREDGKEFVIIGGEHRWEAARELGWESIPCVVLTDDKFQDVDLQRFITLRMNVIQGKLNPEKFRDLYQSMADRYTHESLQKLMGFCQSDAFDKLVGGVREGLRATGLPMSSEMEQEFAEIVEEVKTVDDLSNILTRLFAKYGETLKYNFMVFSFGSKDHVYVQCDRKLFRKVKKLTKEVRNRGISMAAVIDDLLTMVSELDLDGYEKVTEDQVAEARL